MENNKKRTIKQGEWEDVFVFPSYTEQNKFHAAADRFLRKRGQKVGGWATMSFDMGSKSKDAVMAD